MAMKTPSMMSLRSKIREDHLTCTICFNPFSAPKALPCLHTFCEGCIRDYVTGRGFEAQGQFPCPVCRADIPIPPGGISAFPDNHLVASLSDTVESQRTPQKPPPPQVPVPQPSGNHGDGQYRVAPIMPNITPIPENTANGNKPPDSFSVLNYASGTTANGSGIPHMPQYLNPQMPQVMADNGPQGDSGQFGQQYSSPGLYPHLSVESEFKGPCTKGLLVIAGSYGGTVSSFLKPFGLAVGRNGEYIVSDRGGNRILVFSNKGELKLCYNLNCTVNGIAVTKENDVLIAVSKAGSEIMRQYTLHGKFVQKFGDYYRYDLASGIAITPNNHVAITNVQADNVLAFTDQRKFSIKFGWKGTGDRHFMNPQFITSTVKNYVVVSDTGNHCIKVLDLQGNFKRSFGGKGVAHGKLDTPLGVATDQDSNIIIADSNNYRVEIFTVKGYFYTTLVEETNLIGPDVKPINVAVTPRNNIAVLLVGTGYAEVRVYCWKPSMTCANGVSEI